jgi:hypothetical protein
LEAGSRFVEVGGKLEKVEEYPLSGVVSGQRLPTFQEMVVEIKVMLPLEISRTNLALVIWTLG